MKLGIKDLLHDDVEEQFEQLDQKKKKRKKKRRRVRNVLLLSAVIVGIFYFISDYSKVKSLRVIGNQYYNDEQILKAAGLDYNARFLLHPSFLIKHQLKKEALIDDITVSKNLSGGITLKVKEKTVIGYLGKSEKKLTLLTVDGEKITLEEEMLDKRTDIPYIHDFSKNELSNLAKAFSKLKDFSYINMISEIMPHEESYDRHMVKLIMQDGNSVFVSYKGIPMLSHYKDVLKPLEGNHVCLWIDEDTKAIAKRQCPVMETNEPDRQEESAGSQGQEVPVEAPHE